MPTETAETNNEAKPSDVKREISVEIPAEDVTRETDIIIQKYQKSMRLPGFRVGHVPASIIRQRFGRFSPVCSAQSDCDIPRVCSFSI